MTSGDDLEHDPATPPFSARTGDFLLGMPPLDPHTLPMRTVIRLPNTLAEPLPPHLAADEVRFPPEFVRLFLEEHTRPGDVVLDPFAGYGTTLQEAEALGRAAYGVELDDGRLAYARERLVTPHRLVHGDARHLSAHGFPPCDFCMTGIPFCTEDETTDPLTWYASPGRGYPAYLDDLQKIFKDVAALLEPAGVAVIEVANLRGAGGGPVTTLAWDVARSVGQVLKFEGEVVVDWSPTYGYGYDHSYCLIFRHPG